VQGRRKGREGELTVKCLGRGQWENTSQVEKGKSVGKGNNSSDSKEKKRKPQEEGNEGVDRPLKLGKGGTNGENARREELTSWVKTKKSSRGYVVPSGGGKDQRVGRIRTLKRGTVVKGKVVRNRGGVNYYRGTEGVTKRGGKSRLE